MSALDTSMLPLHQGLSGSPPEARPQLQSRRVSVRLGPLGITYATDQVLWTAAAAQASGAARADAPDAGAEAAATAQAQQQVQQSGRSFRQEMADARRRQGRKESVRTYGPDGLLDSAQHAEHPAGAAVQTVETGAQGPDGETKQQTGQPEQQSFRPPGSRMRQAIAAYLFCARDFRAAAPMLTAVA